VSLDAVHAVLAPDAGRDERGDQGGFEEQPSPEPGLAHAREYTVL
jgi:hypothetical protein